MNFIAPHYTMRRMMDDYYERFERASRGIHPDIYASDELAGKAHIVVLEEDDLPEELGQAADLEDVLDEALTTTIGGVCLTCEEELYGVLGVVDDTLQTYFCLRKSRELLLSVRQVTQYTTRRWQSTQ